MGSSTGVARGQLRPQFAGRNPPFIVAGLLIALALLGISYYSLSTQYTTLQTQLENLVKSEERSRITCQERSRENEKLQKLTEQLRDKLMAQTNDLRIKQSDLQTLKESQQMAESNLAAEKNRLESENKGLIEKTGQLQKSLDDINSENVKLKHQLESMDKQAKDKLATIDQLNNKVNELSAKLSSGKQDDKDAVEVKTDLMPSEPGLGDIDSPNGPGEAPNKTADGINGSSEAVKMKDGPSSIISNPDNQKASLPKPNPLGKAEETVNEAAMANLV